MDLPHNEIYYSHYLTCYSIVAIHGLETTSERTWVYKKKGEEKEINWLDNEEMLPAAVPEARIFTYNWDANYYRDGNSADLNDHGRSLISYLHGRLKHEGEQRKPIIFIASCFGGLVLAKVCRGFAMLIFIRVCVCVC